MANSVELVLWFKEDQYKAVAKRLDEEDSTVEKELEKAFDDLYMRLVPDEERASIEEALAKEEQREAELQARREAEAYRVSALLLNGDKSGCWKLKHAWNTFEMARFLRTALRQSEQPTEQCFCSKLGEMEPLSEGGFAALKRAKADGVRQVNGVFLVDFHTQKFYLVRPGEGWEIYRFKDISAAVFKAMRKESAAQAELQRRFDAELGRRDRDVCGI